MAFGPGLSNPVKSSSFCSAAPVLIVGQKLQHRQVALGVLNRSTNSANEKQQQKLEMGPYGPLLVIYTYIYIYSWSLNPRIVSFLGSAILKNHTTFILWLAILGGGRSRQHPTSTSRVGRLAPSIGQQCIGHHIHQDLDSSVWQRSWMPFFWWGETLGICIWHVFFRCLEEKKCQKVFSLNLLVKKWWWIWLPKSKESP